MNALLIIKYVLIVICSYFIGNISFARIISKYKKSDITKKGSGNPGTMNMLRNYGIKLGALTLVLDVLKGAIPALCGVLLFGGFNTVDGTTGLYIAGFSVVLGHIYPVVYKFKGGKGIACALGVFLIADPLWLLLFFVVAFVYLWFFDYGSVASLTVVSALTIIQGIKNYGNLTISLLLFAMFILTLFAHRQNIFRLLVGKENKANLQKSIKKKFNKQKSEIKQEYKETKNEIKQEYKEDKIKYKDDKDKLKKERKKYKTEKRIIKSNYYQKRRRVYDYANVLETVQMKEEDSIKDNE